MPSISKVSWVQDSGWDSWPHACIPDRKGMWEGKVLKELPFKELFQQSHSTAICIVLFTYSCKGGLEFWSWNAENSQVFLRWEEGSWLLGRQSVSFDILAFNYGINEFRFVSSFFFGSHLHPFLVISWSLTISSAVWMGEGSNER